MHTLPQQGFVAPLRPAESIVTAQLTQQRSLEIPLPPVCCEDLTDTVEFVRLSAAGVHTLLGLPPAVRITLVESPAVRSLAFRCERNRAVGEAREEILTKTENKFRPPGVIPVLLAHAPSHHCVRRSWPVKTQKVTGGQSGMIH